MSIGILYNKDSCLFGKPRCACVNYTLGHRTVALCVVLSVFIHLLVCTRLKADSTQENKHRIGSEQNWTRPWAFGTNFLFQFEPVIRNPDGKQEKWKNKMENKMEKSPAWSDPYFPGQKPALTKLSLLLLDSSISSKPFFLGQVIWKHGKGFD